MRCSPPRRSSHGGGGERDAPQSDRSASAVALAVASFAHADVIDNTWLGGADRGAIQPNGPPAWCRTIPGRRHFAFRFRLDRSACTSRLPPPRSTRSSSQMAVLGRATAERLNVLQLADVNGTLTTAHVCTGGAGSLVGNGTILPGGVITANTMLTLDRISPLFTCPAEGRASANHTSRSRCVGRMYGLPIRRTRNC